VELSRRKVSDSLADGRRELCSVTGSPESIKDMCEFLRGPEAYRSSGALTQTAFDAISHYIENGTDGFLAYGLVIEIYRALAVEALLNGDGGPPRRGQTMPTVFEATWTRAHIIPAHPRTPTSDRHVPGHLFIRRNGEPVRPAP
jgi:hypothetical protein